MALSLLGLVMILAGCATLMVAPDGRQVVNCGRLAQTPEGVYWSVKTFGISSAVSNSQCAAQLRGGGWIPMDEWRERANQVQVQETEVRRYWQDGLRPQVVNGTLTAQEAVERLIAKERTAPPGECADRPALHRSADAGRSSRCRDAQLDPGRTDGDRISEDWAAAGGGPARLPKTAHVVAVAVRSGT